MQSTRAAATGEVLAEVRELSAADAYSLDRPPSFVLILIVFHSIDTRDKAHFHVQ